ncbi:MAG: hypothetical protein PHW75_01000 [Patescibacteria group bacterium]|nr:hypothetical protein [Patescibacteria group bacterium]
MNVLNKKQTIIAFVILGLFTILVGVVMWYFIDSSFNTETTESTVGETITEDVQSDEVEIPSDFSKITLNEVEIFYPEDWGTPKTAETKENLSDDLGPGRTFEGEYADWDFLNGTGTYVQVNEMASLKNKLSETQKVITALENTYENKKLDEEDLAGTNFGYIPSPNAGVVAYTARYVENYNSTWRGYWYLGTIGQDINASVHFVSVMYNKDLGKVMTVDQLIPSTMSRALTDRIASVYSGTGTEIEQNKLQNDLTTYIEGVYKVDAEIKETVDSELLNVCNLVGYKEN